MKTYEVFLSAYANIQIHGLKVAATWLSFELYGYEVNRQLELNFVFCFNAIKKTLHCEFLLAHTYSYSLFHKLKCTQDYYNRQVCTTINT